MNADQVRAFVAACYPRAMQSPVAQSFARLTTAYEAAGVCDAAAWSVKETLGMVAAADSYADLHAGTPRDKLREYMDCYLESCYPDAEDELREQIVTRACR